MARALQKKKIEMKTKHRKAFSPVVASIILVAVAVAVSIAVGAWTGALTFGFTSTEQVRITSMTFDMPSNTITVFVQNPGTSPVTFNEVWVNNVRQNATSPVLPQFVTANCQITLNITLGSLKQGYDYQVALVTSKGSKFLYTART